MSDWQFKGTPALVILHMQQGIVGPNCNIPGMYEAVQKSGILPKQQALLKAFRAKKLPVVFLRALHVTAAQDPCGALPAYSGLCRTMEATEATPDNLEIIPEVAPLPGEPVLTNWMIGAFNNSGLDEVLKAKHVETLVLVGCATHIAVYTAALSAIDRWYSSIIVRDACTVPADYKAAEKCVLELLAPIVALVTDTKDVLAKIRQK